MIKQLDNLEKVILNPDDKAKCSVIWLHGLGADGHDFVSIVPQLNIPAEYQIRFIFPHAPRIPVTLNNGYVMPAWFDIFGLDSNSREDHHGLEHTRVLINKLIEDEHLRGIPYNKIVLVGFSQGGAVALYAGLKFPHKLAGIIGLSCFLPRMDQNYNAANQTTPVMLAHGINDQVVLEIFGHDSAMKLMALGYKVNWHSYPMAHQVCTQEISDVSKFLQLVLC